MPNDETQGEDRPSTRLFDEFSVTTAAQWREAARNSLRGADPESLARQTLEGFAVDPIYHAPAAGDAALAHEGSCPGQRPHVRGSRALGHLSHPWKVQVDLDLADAVDWSRAAHGELDNGCDAIGLVLDRAAAAGMDPDQAPMAAGSGGLSIATAGDLTMALRGVDLSVVAVDFQAGLVAPTLAALLDAADVQGAVNLSQVTGSLGFDPLSHLIRTGALPGSWSTTLDTMAELVRWSGDRAPGLGAVTISGCPYHEGGGDAVQEIGFTLAAGADYMRAMIDRGLDPNQVARQMTFCFSVGTRFFTEVAKLRCARMLWDQIAGAFGCDEAHLAMRVSARTSRWTLARRDPWVNILRGSVAASAAVVGGAERLMVEPFDVTLNQADSFTRRVARNAQILLREEASLARVVDPAGGSWFVEAMTDKIGRASWELFQEVERRGGMIQAVAEGFPQQAVSEAAGQRQEATARREVSFVGVSRYADPSEELPIRPAPDLADFRERRCREVLEHRGAAGQDRKEALRRLEQSTSARVPAAAAAAAAGATLGQLCRRLAGGDAIAAIPISVRRGMADFEDLRDAADRHLADHGGRPAVTILSVGSAPALRARVEFAAGLFDAGGFEVEKMAEAVLDGGAAAAAIADRSCPVAVLCAEDDGYPEAVRQMKAGLTERGASPLIVVAGRPPDEPQPWAAEVEFVFDGADVLSALIRVQRAFGLSTGEVGQ